VDIFQGRLNKMDTMDLEANWEKLDAIAEQQGTPKEEAGVETIGALEDQYGDWYLAVGCHQHLNKWTRGDGGSWHKLGTVWGWLTHCAIHARHKRHGHKETIEKLDQGWFCTRKS
jgi:hypothetical protein